MMIDTYINFKNKAFSLIELSIVLIIIGLLVAGITGGASLIQSAKIRGLINEFSDYTQAAYAFKAIKNRLPGDIENTGKIGDNTGYTYSVGDFPAPYDGSDQENHAAPLNSMVGPFVDLYLEKITDFEPKNTGEASMSRTSAAEHKKAGMIPTSKHDKDLAFFYLWYNNPDSSNHDNQQIFSKNLLMFSSESLKINPKIVKSIDLKIDDGIYKNGIIRGNCGNIDYDIIIQNNGFCKTFYKLTDL